MRIVCAALFAVSTIAAAQNADQLMQQCFDQARARRIAGEITRLQGSHVLKECSDRYHGPNPLHNEFWAFHAYISSEIDAGRMGEPQAEYLLAQKQNELRQRATSNALQVLPLLPRPQPAYRPIPQPRQPTYTNCSRDLLGNISCVTQ